jgi:hypothetical protein
MNICAQLDSFEASMADWPDSVNDLPYWERQAFITKAIGLHVAMEGFTREYSRDDLAVAQRNRFQAALQRLMTVAFNLPPKEASDA